MDGGNQQRGTEVPMDWNSVVASNEFVWASLHEMSAHFTHRSLAHSCHWLIHSLILQGQCPLTEGKLICNGW